MRRTPLKLKQRSKISNGHRVLEGIDQRLGPARRYRDLCTDIAIDLGGMDALSTAQMQLVRTAAGLVVMREQYETDQLNGVAVNVDKYIKITNALSRVLATLGLKRRKKDATPDLNDYLASKERARRNGRTIDHNNDQPRRRSRGGDT